MEEEEVKWSRLLPQEALEFHAFIGASREEEAQTPPALLYAPVTLRPAKNGYLHRCIPPQSTFSLHHRAREHGAEVCTQISLGTVKFCHTDPS